MDLEATTDIANRLCAARGWEMLHYIDAGNSGAVFAIRHPDYGDVALKVYDASFFRGDNALIEQKRVSLQRQLRSHGHPNLIDIYEVGEVSEKSTWFLLMELCPWPNLEKSLLLVPEENVPEIIRQLVSAVSFLEERGLVHRDIKPANIAINPGFTLIKLLDLGVLRLIDHTEGNGTDHDEQRRFVATAQYSPPEYLTREELPGSDGFQAINIYQVGAVLHDLIMRTPIFHEEVATGNKYILCKAVTTKAVLVANPRFPPRLVSLCRSALQKDPSARAQTVSLSQLSTKSDTPEEIRRRLGANRPIRSDETSPSVLLWKPQAREWLKTMARREKAALGAHTLKEVGSMGGIAWDLSFVNNSRVLRVTLDESLDKTHLVLALATNTPQHLVVPVLEIYGSGPQAEPEDVLGQLSSNVLYLLDL